MRTCKDYLFRAYFEKRVSYHQLCFVGHSKAGRDRGNFIEGKRKGLRCALDDSRMLAWGSCRQAN